MACWVRSMLVTGLIGMAGAATPAVAHVHGMARLDVAVEEGRIVLALHGAGDNFVGFEHAAQTPEQTAAVRAAEARLQALDGLLVMGADCVRETVEVTLPENLRATRGGTMDDAAGQDHPHDHEDHRDHAQQDATGKRHPSDWWIQATFACAGIASGLTLQARPLFDAFPRLQELQVQAVGANGQAGAALKPDATMLVLP